MTPENNHTLLDLRKAVLSQLGSMSDYMADSEQVSYELLIALARDTNNVTLLQKALEKIEKIEDPQDKVSALTDLLDEIELQISITSPQPSEPQDHKKQER